MYSALNRAQNVIGFFTTVAFFVGALTALSVLLYPANPKTSVELTNIQVAKGRPHYYSTKRGEYAQIRFNLDADFSSLFNWNTKQLFVYVLASYPSTSSSLDANATATTESIIWDTILPAPPSPYSLPALQERFFPSRSKTSKSKRSPSHPTTGATGIPGKIRLRNQKPKYQITDVSGRIAERQNASLVVGWNVQPWIGALLWGPGPNVAGNVQGFGLGFVTGGHGGRSEPFHFPALKGSKVDVTKKDGA